MLDILLAGRRELLGRFPGIELEHGACALVPSLFSKEALRESFEWVLNFERSKVGLVRLHEENRSRVCDPIRERGVFEKLWHLRWCI